MLELIETPTAVVDCLAEPAALDAMVVPSRSVPCRVAADEILLLAHPAEASDVVRQASARLGVLDPDGLAHDVSDGWSSWTLRGSEANQILARLSEIEPPERGFVQGKVAGVPAKILAAPGRLHLMVPSMWGEHLRERLIACAPEGHVSLADLDPAGWVD